MSIDNFRAETQAMLERLVAEASQTDEKELVIERFVDEFARLHGRYAHQMLDEVIAEAHTRLDARLSPDPIRQTIASVQTTVQDLWNTLWGPPPNNRQ